MNNERIVDILLAPAPHFSVRDWSVADAFDDFLTEKMALEFFTKTIERDGHFIAKQFFPANHMPLDEMGRLCALFESGNQ